MSAELIFKIIGIGLLVSVSHQLLTKSGRDEQAMMVTLAGIVIVLFMLVGEISNLLNTIKDLFAL